MTDSAVQIKHKPTNIIVRCENERSQHQNKRTAMDLLKAKLWELKNSQVQKEFSDNRKQQVGSGMRGDKIRTIREKDGIVNDHRTGKKWRYKDYIKGDFQ